MTAVQAQPGSAERESVLRASALRASAPGKLFLLGEYAVLDGAPALLAAVEARVEVTVSAAAGESWTLTTLGLDLAPQRLGPNGELPPAIDDHTRNALRVFDAVREALAGAGRLPAGPFDVTIDSSAFSRVGGKLGLGSSAAVAVALTAALSAVRGAPLGTGTGTGHRAVQLTEMLGQHDRAALFTLADTAHRAAQNGAGSGGDTATSVYGGLISYTRGEVPTQLDWPENLTAMAVVTGNGSSTTELVARIQDYRQRDAAGYGSDIQRLTELARQAADALGSPDGFLGLCSDYFAALSTLDAHAGAGIVTERHHTLHAIAASAGGVFKSSGAGGGDLGLAFSANDDADRMKKALAAAGAELLPLTFGAEGVRVTSGEVADAKKADAEVPHVEMEAQR